jgi:hypothetical protein
MYITDIDQDLSQTKLDKLSKTLREVYEIEVDFGAPREDLVETHRYFSEQKHVLLQDGEFNKYFGNCDYSRAYLICEAIRIFLSEIAPKRMLHRRKQGVENDKKD